MEQQENIEQEVKKKRPSAGRSFSSMLGKLDSVGESGMTVVKDNLGFVVFIVMLAMLHIANTNMAEDFARKITRMEKEVKQLRWRYMTTSSGLMQKSKQSEVAKLVQSQGIKELRVPPFKIEVTETKKD
jgi:hypothetical protein